MLFVNKIAAALQAKNDDLGTPLTGDADRGIGLGTPLTGDADRGIGLGAPFPGGGTRTRHQTGSRSCYLFGFVPIFGDAVDLGRAGVDLAKAVGGEQGALERAGMNVIGAAPGIGSPIKAALKYGDNVVDLARGADRAADPAADGLSAVGTGSAAAAKAGAGAKPLVIGENMDRVRAYADEYRRACVPAMEWRSV